MNQKRGCLSLLLLATVAGTTVSCQRQASRGPDKVLVAGQRLQGTWVLVSFKPEKPLEAPLQGLLDAQMRMLRISFDNSSYKAVGVGLNVQGRFQVLSAEGDLFSGTMYDPTGVGYRVSGQFDGQQFHFASYDAPWRGTGLMERTAAAPTQ
ncbi:MAG TPA: hypothetical protein VFQ61_33050 [Polyangiaceae bacterium]|nr:hypothetical protein [Polyangiaceae bacterium]